MRSKSSGGVKLKGIRKVKNIEIFKFFEFVPLYMFRGNDEREICFGRKCNFLKFCYLDFRFGEWKADKDENPKNEADKDEKIKLFHSYNLTHKGVKTIK